jgi:putative FmdB family regulatory protein
MPVYEYKCGECGRHYDRIRSVNVRDEPVVCELFCQGSAYRVPTVPASIRMGTGTTRRDSGYNRTEV